jgi:hypothetical protein
MEIINGMLPSIGALTLGYLTYRLIKLLVSKIKTNPLRTYIRKEVLNYLKELQDE